MKTNSNKNIFPPPSPSSRKSTNEISHENHGDHKAAPILNDTSPATPPRELRAWNKKVIYEVQDLTRQLSAERKAKSVKKIKIKIFLNGIIFLKKKKNRI